MCTGSIKLLDIFAYQSAVTINGGGAGWLLGFMYAIY